MHVNIKDGWFDQNLNTSGQVKIFVDLLVDHRRAKMIILVRFRGVKILQDH